MRHPKTAGVDSVSRRTVLGNLTTVGLVTVAGCSNAPKSNSSENPDSTPNHGIDASDTFEPLRTELESVFDQIRELPIVVDGELVFDLSYFEDEFSHEELLEKIGNIQQDIATAEGDHTVQEKFESLAVGADMAEHLVRQRILIHQVITAGLTYEQRLFRAEYEMASEAIGDARMSIRYLIENRERITNHPWLDDSESMEIVGIELGPLRNTQDELTEITRWAGAAYEALHESARGFSQFVAGNDELGQNQYSEATEHYREANDHFVNATSAFDRAHGKGQRIPHLVSTFQAIRCMIPAYSIASKKLQRSMNAFEEGDDARGKAIARDAFNETEKTLKTCQ